jgi:hypothetical protein
MSAELTVAHLAPIEPRDMGELRALASAAAASKFFGASTPEQALLLMVTGRDLGLSYAQSLRAFSIIQGKPVLTAQGMVAICLRAKDVCERFDVIEATNERATVEVQRRGSPPRRITFTIEDARRARLDGKDNWKTYPSRMLLARAQAFAAREAFPDLLMGLYDSDEVEATPPPPRQVEVTATPVVRTPFTAASLLNGLRSALVACETAEDIEALKPRLSEAKASGVLGPDELKMVADLYRSTVQRVRGQQARQAPPEREPGDDSEEIAQAEEPTAGEEGGAS